MSQEANFDLKSLISEDTSIDDRIALKLVSEPFNIKAGTSFVIYMIRRQIRAGKGNMITKNDIIRWGNRKSRNKGKFA